MAAGRQSFLKVLAGAGAGAFVPVWEVWFCMHALAERLRERAGHAVATGPGARVRNELPAAARLGWDCLGVSYTGCPLPHRRETASDGTEHYVQGALAGYDDLRGLPWPDPLPLREDAIAGIEAAHAAGLAACCYLPWPFHSICTAMGLERFSYALVDNPADLHACFDYVARWNRHMIEQVVLPSGADLVLFDGDCAYKNGLMIRPDHFRELVEDRSRETVAPLRAAGIPRVLHSDGQCDDLLPVLIDLGFSAFHGVEAAANDLGDIKERFGGQITLIGNMDVVFLSRATPAAVAAATRRMLATGSPGGRYVAACNTSPLDYIPEANYLAMYDAVRACNA